MNDISTDEVWRQFGDGLLSFLERRVRDEELAKDLLQETFIRIHRGLDGLRDQGLLRVWVHRIARHVVIDHFRSARPVDSLPSDPPMDVDDENVNGEVAGWLEGLIRLTPEPTRTALWLAEVEGLPQAEVAERQGLSLSGAKSRIQRGRALLEAMLRECCHLELDRRGNVLAYERRGQCSACCPDES
ncbi:MAG: RNA polymerase sigma factor SigZ [Planctomycetota bacterium]